MIAISAMTICVVMTINTVPSPITCDYAIQGKLGVNRRPSVHDKDFRLQS